MSVDLEDVIVSSIEDSVTPEAPEVDTPESTETPLEATPEAPEAATPTPEGDEPAPVQVASPGQKAGLEATSKEQEDFEKKYGIPKESTPGRENRIPYSRVTKIVAKAVKDAETTFAPKLAEFETKVKDYEGKLSVAAELEKKVASFEKVMLEDPDRFMAMLKTLPQYSKFLSAPPLPTPEAEAPVQDDMPMPDEPMDPNDPEGPKVYSMEGLKALNAWNRAQARKETLAEVEKVYGPIAHSYEESQRQAQERAAALKYQQEVVIPQINAQMAEARSWDLFTENEEAIVKVMNEHPEYNVERAYQTVVFPKFKVSHSDMRKQVIKELQKAPAATSAPSSGTRPQTQPVRTGKQDLEDIIKQSIETHPNR